MSDTKDDAAVPAKKKGKLKKLLVIGVGGVALIGGGVGAGLYAASSGMVGGGGHAAEADSDKPKLVPKSEQKRAGEGSGEGGGSSEEEGAKAHAGKPTPEGEGGDKYATNYYPIEKEFTANLAESVHMVQVGVAIGTPYDDKVVENIKTNEIAVRSAILLALGEATEEQVMTAAGKQQLQRRLAKAINDTLEQKEGFGGVGNVYFTNFIVQ